MKFKIGQEVMIASGVMRGRVATVIQVYQHGWYDIKIEDKFDRITYLECELEVIH